MKSLFRRASSLVAGAALMAAGPSMASVVIEFGDAGQTLGTAQVARGDSSPLTAILGLLSSSTDADLYLINIVNPGMFSATTVNSTGNPFFDTQLFLLTLSGAPVYLNDDADGSTVRSTLPAGSLFGPVSAGLYILGISLSGYDPVNEVSQLLFEMGLTTDVRGPVSLLQPARLGGFFDSMLYTDAFDAYRIQLTGATAVAEPSSALLAVLAGTLCAGATVRRRRRPKALPSA